MTRKHFNDLAGALKEFRQHEGAKLDEATFQALVTEIGDVCRKHNQGFQRDRFFRAATPTEK